MRYPRREYEMTEADLDMILNACKPVPCIMIGNIPPPTQQENANRAWAELGRRMNFDPLTVEPTGRGDRFFSAVPLETPEQKAERVAKEAEEARLQEIRDINRRIGVLSLRLSELEKNHGKSTE